MSASVLKRPQQSKPGRLQLSLPLSEPARPASPPPPDGTPLPVILALHEAPQAVLPIPAEAVLEPEQPLAPAARSVPTLAVATPAEDASADEPSSVVEAPHNLADVLLRLAECDSMSPDRRANIRSAVRALSRVLGRSLADIPTDPAQLRELMANASPASAGLSPARWARIRSLTLAALRDLGIRTMPGRSAGRLSSTWRAFAASLPDKRSRIGLSRFMSYCSREGIGPDDIDDATFAGFRDALLTTSLHAKPEAIYRTTIRLWNLVGRNLTGTPDRFIPLPSDHRTYALAWDAFPVSFRSDVQHFLAHTGNQDPLADDYAPSVKTSTIAMRHKQILQLASALVASGWDPELLTNLRILVQPANAKAALRYLLGRKGGKTTPYLGQQAQLLRTIARHWVKVSADDLAALRGFATGLATKQRGMVAKNRAKLRQFDLPATKQAFLDLPGRVAQEVEKKDTGSRKDALRVMLALAVGLLTASVLRADNFTGLEVGRHLVEIRRGRTRVWHIVIPAAEAKTNAPYETKLPERIYGLLESYLQTYRLRVNASPGPWLFPGPTGRRNTTTFSKLISNFVQREVGIRLNVHLVRHVAVKLHLDEHPEDIETARQLLGHRSSTTTLRSYAELRTDQAFLRYEQTISALRDQADRVAAKPRGRKPGAN
jgi:integrase